MHIFGPKGSISSQYSFAIVLGIIITSSLLAATGVNSILITSGIALMIVLVASLRNGSLASRAAIGGISAMTALFAVYAAGFLLSTNTEFVLQNIWLLYGTSLDMRIVGVPLTELLWGLAFGALAAIL